MISLPTLLLGAPLAALAQDDHAAGLYTTARQLPIMSQSLTVEIADDEATLHLTQVFVNTGEGEAQADYQLHLPTGGAVTAFGFWNDDRFLEASLQASGDAEARHTRAAESGRPTALLSERDGVQRFSVYPVAAGALKQVEVSMRVPIDVDLGRHRVRLPIDAFLGQSGPTSAVLVDLRTREPLDGAGIDGAQTITLNDGPRRAQLAATADGPIELWWRESGPDLGFAADTVAFGDGDALALRVVLNEAPVGATTWDSVAFLVDSSASMGRWEGALSALVGRVAELAARPAVFYAVGEDEIVPVPISIPRETAAALLHTGQHGAHWFDMEEAMTTAGCGPKVRCVIVTDAQLEGLASAEQSAADLLLFSDAHTLNWLGADLPTPALIHQPGVDSDAQLRTIVDNLTRPTLRVTSVTHGVTPLTIMGTDRSVAEGGMLRLFSQGTALTGPITVEGRLADQPFTQVVHPSRIPQDRAQTTRRAVATAALADMLKAYRNSPAPTLRDEIVQLSLREGVPTPFTSLQVDDPTLSLVAIKPGDPVLTVAAEPGLTDVTVMYPFGEHRRLVRDPVDGTFSDRFLVPRYWAERAYRVDVHKRFADGDVRAEHVWYLLDEGDPTARLWLADGALIVDAGAGAPDIGRVSVHAGDTVIPLEAEDGRWSIPIASLPSSFTVFVRDRAGNRARFDATVVDGELTIESGSDSGPHPLSLPRELLPIAMVGDGLRIDGHEITMRADGRRWTFDAEQADLSDLRLTGWADLGPGRTLFATAGGDIVRLDCARGVCEAAPLADFAGHPVTGLVQRPGGLALISVLGEGLLETDGAELWRSDADVGTRRITAMASTNPEDTRADVLIGTATRGMWRMVHGATGDRVWRTRLDADTVLSMSSSATGLRIRTPAGEHLRVGRDRFEPTGDGLNHAGPASPDIMDATILHGERYLAAFDAGLWTVSPTGQARPVGGERSPSERRLNALERFEGLLWVGSEAGLHIVDTESGDRWQVLDGAVHDLDVGAGGLAVASSSGMWSIDSGGALTLRDDSHRYMSVAWHDGALYGGHMDGLNRSTETTLTPLTADHGADAHWVTALLSDGDRMLIGTYADGVYSLANGHVSPVEGLHDQWVPALGLSRVGSDVWVGGIGMPAVRLEDDGPPVSIPLPVRDVNRVLPAGDTLLFLTSAGLASTLTEGATLADTGD